MTSTVLYRARRTPRDRIGAESGGPGLLPQIGLVQRIGHRLDPLVRGHHVLVRAAVRAPDGTFAGQTGKCGVELPPDHLEAFLVVGSQQWIELLDVLSETGSVTT